MKRKTVGYLLVTVGIIFMALVIGYQFSSTPMETWQLLIPGSILTVVVGAGIYEIRNS